MIPRRWTVLAGVLAMLACDCARADDAPSTGAIIEALKPLTRSSRNLIVTGPPKPAEDASTPAPAAPVMPGAATSAVVTTDHRPQISMAIRFDFDSARIRPESVEALNNLAAALASAALGGNRFLVEGHTDATGGTDYNLRLSQRRADEVKRFLVAHGVASERLATFGRGSTEPAEPADPRAEANRRVRVLNLE